MHGGMTEVLLRHHIPIATEADLRRVPARWAVILLADESGQPLQLLGVKNPRQALRHRWEEPESPTRKVKWRELVRQVWWQPVDSPFEADWVFLEAARRFFPQTYQDLVGWAETWFVHVDPDATFPRYAKTTKLASGPGTLIGPLPDKSAAGRLIELLEDAFDLCRYHHILVQYPDGRACAYKEMGKCPAPCDGSISIDQYRRLVEMSVAALSDLHALIQVQIRRMEAAAAELQFETATRIKAYIEQLRHFYKGALQYARPIAEFAFITVQPGPRAGQAKVFLILPGHIEPIACLLGEPAEGILDLVENPRVEEAVAERVGVVARHLFAAKQEGVFIPLGQASDAALIDAYRLVCRCTKEEP
jgi:excinuclease UvrABC nuclease subunit